MGERLSALDHAFFAIETPRTPVNIAALQIFQIPPNNRGNFVRRLLKELRTAEPGPPFNKKLLRNRVSQLLEWIPDEAFDLDYHVRHLALPRPGEMSDLLDLVSNLHTRLLDRTRPLWEFNIIEGLRGNKFAIYLKLHHATVDGMGAMALLESCLSTEPDAEPMAVWKGLPGSVGDQNPNQSLSLLDSVGSIFESVKITRDIGKLLVAHGSKALNISNSEAPALFTAPKTIFNQQVSAARRFRTSSISLSAVKQLARSAGATVNDVVLAICSGALRSYLEAKDALPTRSLIATIPMAIKGVTREGNQITYVAADLATTEDDLMERLTKINRSTQAAKSEVAQVVPAAATGYALAAQSILAVLNKVRVPDLIPPLANVVISNVPGPRAEQYLGGAVLEANYPVSVLADGQALNITVVSCADSIDFGLLGCRETLPDIDVLAQHIPVAFAELESAVAEAHGKADVRLKPKTAKRRVKKKTPGRERK